MKKSITLFVLVFFCFGLTIAQAQEAADGEETPPEGWTRGAGIGLDFSQLFQLNPKQGAGQNRIGIGGAVNFFANYKKARIAWDNNASWKFGVQRIGTGVIAVGSDESIPFEKAIDELRLNSKVGYQTSENSIFFYAADFSFLSQLTSTFSGTAEAPGNFLRDISGQDIDPISKFFSPATITISAGVDIKPNENWSFFYSPLSAKFIIVADDNIADDVVLNAEGTEIIGSVHGNPIDADGLVITNVDNVFSQLGSLAKATYTDKYWEDKVAFTSTLALYSNYLNNPQNIDIDWNSELAVAIVKGLQLTLTTTVFYDDDIFVQITDNDAPGGVNGLGKRVNFVQQLLIKYNLVF